MQLKGSKVILRPLDREDLERSRQWVTDSDTARGLLRTLPVTQPEQERWFERISTDSTRMVWAIQADGEHVGNTGLYYIDLLHRRAEAWFLIGSPERRGQGLGKEAAELLLQYAFQGLGLNKVYLHVGKDNIPAIRLYQGLGFVQEGELVQEYFIQGSYLDVLRMRILASEWHHRHKEAQN